LSLAWQKSARAGFLAVRLQGLRGRKKSHPKVAVKKEVGAVLP